MYITKDNFVKVVAVKGSQISRNKTRSIVGNTSNSVRFNISLHSCFRYVTGTIVYSEIIFQERRQKCILNECALSEVPTEQTVVF